MKFFKEGIGEIPGLFGLEHLIFVVIAAILLFLLLFFSLKKKDLNIDKIIKICFFATFILEILKIIWNLTLREDVTFSDWIPLYFCSIFIYASFLATFFKGRIKDTGLAFIYHGGIIGGIIYFICPNTCLLVHPFLHVLTVHALIYHVILIYLGVLIVLKKVYQPKVSYLPHYLIITFSVCILAYITNLILDSNLMLISKDFGTWPLTVVYKTFKGFYPLVVSLLQNFGTFFVSLGIYVLVIKIIENKRNKAEVNKSL